MMWQRLNQYGSPERFYRLSAVLLPWLSALTALLFAYGLYGALVGAPPDYQQGDGFRIIYVHVPSAWMSMVIYTFMAVMALTGTVWKFKLAEVLACVSAPIGASFTFLALVTGSIWGKPMWGTWWVWDARLTSELLLLFLYLGFMALRAAIPDQRAAWRAGAILLLVGAINIPVIHFSVEWWNTLHQPATITKLGAPSIHLRMLIPLLVMACAFKLLYLVILLIATQGDLLRRGGRWTESLAAA